MTTQQAPRKGFAIQVGGAPGAAVTPEMSTEEFIEATQERLNRIANVIEDATSSFIQSLGSLETKPAECSIEFGVNAGGEAGVPFVTKGTVGANFKVALKWDWSKSK